MPDRWFETHRWAWSALAALLLIFSFAPFSCATCGWIALVPAWWLLTRSATVRQRPFRFGYAMGVVAFAGLFWWIGNVTVIGTLFLIFFLPLYPACWFLFVARLILRSRRYPLVAEVIAAASFWTLLEWLRGWFLTGFNWNELGDSQATSIIFRQLAAYGGVHLISFVLVVVNVLWAEGLLALLEGWRARRPFRIPGAFMAGLLVTVSAFALGWHHLLRHRGESPGPALTFACIQPNIPQIPYDGGPWINFQHKEDEALAIHVQLSRQALEQHPRLLLWPEATIDEGVFQDRPMNEAVRDLSENNDGYFLLGSQDVDLGKHQIYNSAYIFSPRGDQYDEYRKTRLVVLGEYLPFGDRFPWLRRALGIGMDFTPGDEPKKFTLENPAVSLAPLICFEDTLPEVAMRAAELHPDGFVTITNDGWYQGWCAAWGLRQHLANAVFRCVEHDRPMIRCANNGISCLIDADGTVADRFRDARGGEIDVRGIFPGTLRTFPAHRTLYEAGGEWIVLLSGLVGVMLALPFLVRPARFRT